jgi:hypothetical protein
MITNGELNDTTWHAPVIEELSIPGGTEGVIIDDGVDDGTLS